MRDTFAGHGKPDATIAGLAYVAIGDDPQEALDEATHHVLRYYGRLWTEPENLIHHGPATKIAEEVAAYADAVDVLIVVPEIPSSARSSSSRSTCSRRTQERRRRRDDLRDIRRWRALVLPGGDPPRRFPCAR